MKRVIFDNLFFKMSGIQAQKTDPQLRFLLELSYEALVDAGMDIMKIRGSNAGVYVGSCFSDCHKGTYSYVVLVCYTRKLYSVVTCGCLY